MKNIESIKNKILAVLQDISRTEYFTIYSEKGEEIKLRIGNHSGNTRNNGDAKTLSFVSNRTTQRRSAYNSIIEEWEIDIESGLTDTYQSITEVLEWEGVANDQQAAKELWYEL